MPEENDMEQAENQDVASTVEDATAPSQELLDKLVRAERILYGRVIVASVLFCAFAALEVIAVLTGKMSEQGGYLLVLLVMAILALPRQVLSPNLVNQLPLAEREAKIDRINRIQRWLVIARGVFFFSAVLLFAVLPEIV